MEKCFDFLYILLMTRFYTCKYKSRVMILKHHQPRILCPPKLPFRNEGEIKTSAEKQTFVDFN